MHSKVMIFLTTIIDTKTRNQLPSVVRVRVLRFLDSSKVLSLLHIEFPSPKSNSKLTSTQQCVHHCASPLSAGVASFELVCKYRRTAFDFCKNPIKIHGHCTRLLCRADLRSVLFAHPQRIFLPRVLQLRSREERKRSFVRSFVQFQDSISLDVDRQARQVTAFFFSFLRQRMVGTRPALLPNLFRCGDFRESVPVDLVCVCVCVHSSQESLCTLSRCAARMQFNWVVFFGSPFWVRGKIMRFLCYAVKLPTIRFCMWKSSRKPGRKINTLAYALALCVPIGGTQKRANHT